MKKLTVVKRMELARRSLTDKPVAAETGERLTYDMLVYSLTDEQIEKLYDMYVSTTSNAEDKISVVETKGTETTGFVESDGSEKFREFGRGLVGEARKTLASIFVDMECGDKKIWHTIDERKTYTPEGHEIAKNALTSLWSIANARPDMVNFSDGGKSLTRRVTKVEREDINSLSRTAGSYCRDFAASHSEFDKMTDEGGILLNKLICKLGSSITDELTIDDILNFSCLTFLANETNAGEFWRACGLGVIGSYEKLSRTYAGAEEMSRLIIPKRKGGGDRYYNRVVKTRVLFPLGDFEHGQGVEAVRHPFVEPELLPTSYLCMSGEYMLCGYLLAIPLMPCGFRYGDLVRLFQPKVETAPNAVGGYANKLAGIGEDKIASWLGSHAQDEYTECYISVVPVTCKEAKTFCELRGFSSEMLTAGFDTYGDFYKALCEVEDHHEAYINALTDLSSARAFLNLRGR